MIVDYSTLFVFFFFKQKTAYEMRISDWSSDVCSSDLLRGFQIGPRHADPRPAPRRLAVDVGRDGAVRPERKAHEPIGRRHFAGDDAAPLGHMPAAPSSAVWLDRKSVV